jgi:hypothetical protein
MENAGFGGHANPGVTYWGNLGFVDCTVTACVVGWNLKDAATATLTGCTYTGFNDADCRGIRASSDIVTSLTVTDCTITVAGGRAISDSVGISVIVTGLIGTTTAAMNAGWLYSDVATAFDLQGSTFNGVDLSGDTAIYSTHADATIYSRTNVFNNVWRMYVLATKANLDSDYNTISEDATRNNVPASYTSIAAYQAGESPNDANSTVG